MLLVADRVTKRFGKTLALNDVSLQVQQGEIHAVVGENGAGKSTLASVLSGFLKPDEGQVSLDRQPVPLGKPFDSKRLGIAMVHQHFTLVPEFSVAENLALSNLPSLTSRAPISDLAAPALAIGRGLGWTFDARSKVEALPVGTKQKLEILKVLSSHPKVVIFDEPTAVLSGEEVNELFGVLRKLREDGCLVILIAHKLSEVMEIADRATVLRKGQVVASAAKGEYDADQLAKWMVGDMPILSQKAQPHKANPGLTVQKLTVKGDRGEIALDRVSLSVGRGEILGVGGVDGNGQLELAEALAGIRKPESGTIDNIGLVGYIPQDRGRDGVASGLSVAENLLPPALTRAEFRLGPLLLIARILSWASGLIARFEIKAPGPRTLVSDLSGGNQQKVVVARALDAKPDLLIVSGPSRGLDIRATSNVWEAIRTARDSGSAVLLISADLDELSALSDRIVYLSRGKLIEGSDAAALVGGAT